MHLVDLSCMCNALESLHVQAKYLTLTHRIDELRAAFESQKNLLQRLRIWLISSTEKGGGVAEMLPRIICMMRELGMEVEWLILDVEDVAQREPFFALTKRLHNNIHGVGEPVDDSQRPLYEQVNAANTDDFFTQFCPDVDVTRDIICIHDPQPAGMTVQIKKRYPGLRVVWRSHIGLDSVNAATAAAWHFLEPYVTAADVCVFSTREYIPRMLRGKSFVVHPGIAPLAPKNKELTPYDVTQLLMRAGLMNVQRDILTEARGCELADPPFAAPARIYGALSRAATSAAAAGVPVLPVGEASAELPAVSPAASPSGRLAGDVEDSRAGVFWDVGGTLHIPERILEDGIAFLNRPVVCQISRWDRLKGWRSLLEGWVLLKTHAEEFCDQLACLTPSETYSHDTEKHLRMIRNSVLVLAGPEPKAIADDPEGTGCLAELKGIWDNLSLSMQRDIKIVELPMDDVVANALIVNAIQRASTVLVQNSIQEGFGLTATEAMFKRTCFVGTEQAVGLRTQVRHMVDGVLVQGDPQDPANVARALNLVLGSDVLRESLAVNGERRANGFLIYTQMTEWIRSLAYIVGPGTTRRKLSSGHASASSMSDLRT